MPRKLEPGFEATYSMFSDLRTSTMKSPPGRSVVSSSATTAGGSASRAAAGAAGARGPWVADAGDAAWAAAATESGTSAAALVTAAPFRKFRRSTERLLDIASPYEPVNDPM